MDDSSVVARHVLELLEGAEKKTLPGSQLAAVVKFRVPGFKPVEHGCANLREFITKHLPSSVTEVRRQGADIVYGVRPPAQVEVAENSPAQEQSRAEVAPRARVFIDPAVWKTFSNPTTNYKLFGNPDTKEIRVTFPGEASPASPWVQIPSCTAESHLQIARDFVSSVAETSHQTLLSQLLDKPRWWVPFFGMAEQLGLAAPWTAFRSQRLLKQLESALDRLGIPLPEHQGTLSRRERMAAHPSEVRSASGDRRDLLLRRLAVGVVQQMSTAELRALVLPLGYVVDELGDR